MPRARSFCNDLLHGLREPGHDARCSFLNHDEVQVGNGKTLVVPTATRAASSSSEMVSTPAKPPPNNDEGQQRLTRYFRVGQHATSMRSRTQLQFLLSMVFRPIATSARPGPGMHGLQRPRAEDDLVVLQLEGSRYRLHYSGAVCVVDGENAAGDRLQSRRAGAAAQLRYGPMEPAATSGGGW